jgi:hypothetical protein
VIPALAGVVLIIAGVARVLFDAGRNWNRWRSDMRNENIDPSRKVSHLGIILVAIGVVLVLLGTSVTTSPPPAP